MPQRLRFVFALALALILTVAMAGATLAHPERGASKEDFPGEGVASGDKHGGQDGHLPGRIENVELVGQVAVEPRPGSTEADDGTGDQSGSGPGEVENPSSPLEGRIADVGVHTTQPFAYLAAFREPTCKSGGVFTVDISDPANPVELPDAFIPAKSGVFVGEGVQVIDIANPSFTGQVLLFNNEICDLEDPEADGGLTLVDVTDPRNPEFLAENVGDTTQLDPTTGEEVTIDFAPTIHSVFGWNDDGRTYAVTVDNEEPRDIDILDITDPRAPVVVSETSFVDDERVVEQPRPNGDSQFFHDVQVKEIDGRQTMLASYWDNGYIILDVEDPANPVYLRDTDFADVEPFADELGLPEPLVPEGNAHYAEFSPDNQFFLATDEDFNPFRVIGEVTSGEFEGRIFTAAQGSDVPQLEEGDDLPAPETRYVGDACDDPPAGGANTVAIVDESITALVERGTCTFTEKAQNVQAAGYGAGLLFNDPRPGCDSLINMLVEADIPFLSIPRSAGLNLLNQEFVDCTQPTASAPGDDGETVDLDVVFDGWGYVHLYDANTMEEIDQYAVEESLDPRFADGFGDLSVHEVTFDPNQPGIAYISYYDAGFRVVEYSDDGIEEVGVYIAEDGNNFWGVQFYTDAETGEDYVLASDRDSGLAIFQFDDDAAGGGGGGGGGGGAPGGAACPDQTEDDSDCVGVEPGDDGSVTVSLELPAGTVTVTIQGLSGPASLLVEQIGVGGLSDAGGDLVLLPPAFDIELLGDVSFTTATVTIPYDPDNLPEESTEDGVGLFHYSEDDASTPVDITTDVDTDADTVTGETTSFSPFVAAVEAPDALSGVVRVAGPDRIATAIETSQAAFDDGEAGAVVLARADVFADALAGTPLAIQEDAPILLTGSENLDAGTEAEIQRVLPDGGTVSLLGGTAALDQPVQDRLDELGYDTQRFGGLNRADTAVIIARDGLGEPGTLLVADGSDFPDAISAGAAAGAADAAVLLTADDTLLPETQAYLEAHEDTTRFAVGGDAAAALPDATPLVGATRIETAIAVAEEFFPAPAVVGLATGESFADGLSGGALVGRRGGPILLTMGEVLPDTLGAYLEGNADSIDLAYVFGGTAAIAEQVEQDVLDLLDAAG